MDLIQIPIIIPGTLAANHTFTFTTYRDMSLVHVSAVNSSANAGKVKVGTSADDDGYLTDQDVGVSATPAEYDMDDFDGALLTEAGKEHPHVTDGTIFSITITDHASHMANVFVLLTFAAG